MKFQLMNWINYDDFTRGYIVQAFGRSENGDTVCLEMTGFKPYFNLLLPQERQSSFFLGHCEELKKFMKEKNVRGIHDISIKMKKPLYPYTEKFRCKFVCISFTTEYALKTGLSVIKEYLEIHPLIKNCKIYDSTLISLLKLQHEINISPCSWVQMNVEQIDHRSWFTSVDYKEVYPISYDSIAPFKIMSFDIECISHESYLTNDSIFPNATQPNDTCSQIGITLNNQKTVLVINEQGFFTEETLDCDDVCIIPCLNERDLLLKFARFIKTQDPDVIIGYNTFGFDYAYIYERLKIHNIEEEFMTTVSRHPKRKSYFSNRRLSSSAYGDNFFKIIMIPGRTALDLMMIIKKEHKLESYKLDDVAYHFLQQNKHDLKPAQLFQKLKQSKESIIEVALYCAQDTFLVIELIEKLFTMPNLIEMANITLVPIDYLMLRGQQIKCYSMICQAALKESYAIPESYASDAVLSEEEYVGASVLEPKRGVYLNDKITVLDFASLYPSIVIAFNMCHSTLLPETITHEKEHNIEISGTVTHRFTMKHEGLLPKILMKLWSNRKNVKKQMKNTTDRDLLMILNGRQLAIKISMNSMYGFCGATRGLMPCKAIAESITAKGRELILWSKQKVESLYNGNIVYGDSDSIYVKFPNSENMTMNELFEFSTECQNTLNTFYPSPIEIEFEKVYSPFILFTKKRYCALVWEKPDRHDHVEYKGISIIRRDFCKYTRETLDEVLSTVLYERDIMKSRLLFEERVKELIQSKTDISKLIMSKNLNSNYKANEEHTRLPHVKLVLKMKKRDPNNYPKPGERVQYLIIDNNKELLCDKAEHPDYVREHGLSIDHIYYLEQQLLNPAREIFELLIPHQPFNIYKGVENDIRCLKNYKNKQHAITSFFRKV